MNGTLRFPRYRILGGKFLSALLESASLLAFWVSLSSTHLTLCLLVHPADHRFAQPFGNDTAPEGVSVPAAKIQVPCRVEECGRIRYLASHGALRRLRGRVQCHVEDVVVW